jgi:elongin-A
LHCHETHKTLPNWNSTTFITMAPASLQQQCTRAAARNIKRIDEDGLGDTPWRLLKPIINKCEDPKMLHAWEVNTPQIRGETGEIWMKFIKRDVPNWRSKPHEPKNPLSWYRVYKKLKAEADVEERRAEELLKEKMSKIKKDEASWKVAAPTKAIPEKSVRNKGVAMQFQRGSDNNGLRFTTGTKTKDFMSAVRRQAAESKLQKTGVLARPTSMLNTGNPRSKIAQAPQHMMADRQRQADLARPSAQRAAQGTGAGSSAVPARSLAQRAAHDLKVREERLRAVREGRVGPAQANPPLSTNASQPSRPQTSSSRNNQSSVWKTPEANLPPIVEDQASRGRPIASGIAERPGVVKRKQSPSPTATGVKRKPVTILRDVKRKKM